MNPTPTDPREIKPAKVFLVTMRERQNDGATETVSFRSGIYVSQSEAHAKVAMLESRQSGFAVDELDAKPFDTTFLTAQLESTNSKLAAEIAELKLNREAAYKAAVHNGELIAKLSAELEAARKERDESIKERDLALDDLNTALAAKDAAEKRVAVLEAVILKAPHDPDCCSHASSIRNSPRFRCNCWKAAAIAPAPTQEPPAGGVTILNDSAGFITRPLRRAGDTSDGSRAGAVTISTEKKGGDEPCAPPNQHVEGASLSANAKPQSSEDAQSTGASNSPADVPSEGRGELLPFNLSDALAKKPVVTRDGQRVINIQQRSGIIVGYLVDRELRWCLSGRWHRNINSRLDLFMLPTEGSGA